MGCEKISASYLFYNRKFSDFIFRDLGFSKKIFNISGSKRCWKLKCFMHLAELFSNVVSKNQPPTSYSSKVIAILPAVPIFLGHPVVNMYNILNRSVLLREKDAQF